MIIKPRNVRTRLALSYALTLTLVLVAYSIGIFFFLKHNLLSDLDRHLREDIEAVQDSLQDLSPMEPDSEFVKFQERPNYDIRERWLLEVWALHGGILFARPSSMSPALLPPDISLCMDKGIHGESFLSLSGLRLRSKCTVVEYGQKKYLLRVTRSAEHLFSELDELLMLMALGVPLGIFISAIGGYMLARRALSPIDRMVQQAQAITAEQLGERLQVDNPDDELGKLASAFNETFARLGHSFEQARRFSADASHELRTPLTVIRTLGEIALRDVQVGASHAEVISSILEEADRLRHLIESLLTLSRADAGHLKLDRKNEKLSDLVEEVVDHLSVLAEEKSQKILLEIDPDVIARCDRNVLRQAIINLVDNAIKYSPCLSEIRIVLGRRDHSSIIEVKDQGPGIAEDQKEKIFDRFYRIDPARSRERGGTGLGLSIAKWAAEVNGGRIELESEPTKGSTFRIVLG